MCVFFHVTVHFCASFTMLIQPSVHYEIMHLHDTVWCVLYIKNSLLLIIHYYLEQMLNYYSNSTSALGYLYDYSYTQISLQE